MADTDTTSNWAVTLTGLAGVAGAVVCAVIWPLPTMAVSLIALLLIVSSLDKSTAETPVEITPEVVRAIALAAAMLREEDEADGESGGGQPH